MDQFNSNLLEDVTIGYQMKTTKTQDSQSLLVDLEPCWYYLYDGDWKPLTLEDSGRGIELDWSRIKTIFIICFLMLDIYLIYEFFKIQDSNQVEVQTQTEASFEKTFERR